MKMMTIGHKLLIAATVLATVHTFVINSKQPLCTSEIYCSGEVLHTIQMAKIFNDSKTFVDMKLKKTPKETVQLFHEFMAQHGDRPTRDDIIQFVSTNFEKRGTEFVDWVPDDWKESPKYMSKIKDANFRDFANELNKLWKILGRKMKEDVANNPDLYSIIYVKNGVIVPGGRFREFYYWDSYWIVRGLLHSEMYDTVKGMLRNFFSVIDRYGFIPNGGRIYYLIRSQPPMLASMVKSYVDFTNDVEFITEALPRLEAEFDFFTNNRAHNVNGYELYAYGPKALNGPRPESYYEDYDLARRSFTTEDEKMQFYSNLKAAAESGMDFSSRWFIKNGTNEGQLRDNNARSIVPVELNSMIYFNAKILADYHSKLGNDKIAAKYEYKSQKILEAVEAVLWNEEDGAWYDYDLLNQKHRSYYSSTNLSPLMYGCYNIANKSAIARKVLAYIDSNSLDAFPGGVPTTLMQTGEQWDYPNAWAPLQHWLGEGLRNLDDRNATDLANKWTNRWTLSNYIAYKETKAMFEKYSAETLGGHGGGGEYDVQIGFGWTNGVIIEYLAKYGDNLTTFN
uniref:Trehalase n=1 Tax=Sitodiplosis mosellana TaxID=263140 RepID=A0A8T9M861_9DIPT|nr:soluble trehalase 2 [Sitodiplosis mosellana]